jgi:hypothetical protein
MIHLLLFVQVFSIEVPCTLLSTKHDHPDNMILIEAFDIFDGFTKAMISNKNILKGINIEINDYRFSKYRLQRFSVSEGSSVRVSEYYYKDQIVPKDKVRILVSLFYKINILFKGSSNFRDRVLKKCMYGTIRNGSKDFNLPLYNKILINTLSEYKSYTNSSREDYFNLFKKVLSRMLEILYKKEKFPDMYEWIRKMEEKHLYDFSEDLYSKIKRINDILEDRVVLPEIYLDRLVEFNK